MHKEQSTKNVKRMIGIIDYGLGNLASIRNMLRRIGVQSVISGDRAVLQRTDALILPGVGAFDAGVSNLKDSGLWEFLNERVLQDRTPVLGICLGVQLLTEGSDEGQLSGLGWIKGRTIAFDRSRLKPEDKIPNMGWRDIQITRATALTDNLPLEPRFYCVHSFHLSCQDPADEIISCEHGYSITVGVQRDNIWGVQFHPEKSHKFGMKLLENFSKLAG
jgi:glutamine amidotransferase